MNNWTTTKFIYRLIFFRRTRICFYLVLFRVYTYQLKWTIQGHELVWTKWDRMGESVLRSALLFEIKHPAYLESNPSQLSGRMSLF